MTNILTNWDQITEFAAQYGLPVSQKRAIAREFLQAKIISILYSQKISQKLYFVGGTALRLLFSLDRFSEDLDFDAPDITTKELERLMDFVQSVLKKENFRFIYYKNHTAAKTYFELRFPKVLFELKETQNESENLMIKFDFEHAWKFQKQKIVLFNRYGTLANVATKTFDQFMVEKLVAYLERKETLARDLYDLVWLAAQGAKPDREFALSNGYKIDHVIRQARAKFTKENVEILERKLSKYLLNPSSQGKIAFFPQLFPGKNPKLPVFVPGDQKKVAKLLV